jgi:tRNA threonylcarbamoyladenosine biosynthesis protein TsaB
MIAWACPRRPLAYTDRTMARLLAVDCSTQRLCLALTTPQRTWTLDLEGGPQASARLIPEARQLLERAGLRWADLDGLAFGAGPGAFTGLRTACSVVQGWAHALRRPVLAIDSLHIVAEDARAQVHQALAAPGRPSPSASTSPAAPDAPDAPPDPGEPPAWWVAMDARMDEVYAACLQPQAEGWRSLRPSALYTLPALQALWRTHPPGVVAGTALDAMGERLLLAPNVQRVSHSMDRAAALARLAQWAWLHGPRCDAAEAHPHYVRDKVALTQAEREARVGVPA